MSTELNPQPSDIFISPEQVSMETGLELARAALESPEGQGQRQQLVQKLKDILEPSGLVVLDLEKPSSPNEHRFKSGLTRQQALAIIDLKRKRPLKRTVQRQRLGYNR